MGSKVQDQDIALVALKIYRRRPDELTCTIWETTRMQDCAELRGVVEKKNKIATKASD